MKKTILFLINFVYFFVSCHRAVPEIFLIPKDYKGRVMVVFEKKNGSKPKYEHNKRVYDIPISGILVTQFPTNPGFMNREFYYVDSIGQRTPIRNFRSTEDARNSNETGIFYSGTAGVIGNSGDSLSIMYDELIVSDYNNIKTFFSEDYKQQFDKRLQQAVGYEIK